MHLISGGASAPANLYCRCPAGAARLAVPSRRPKGLSIDLLAAPPLLAVLWGPPSEGYWLPHQGGGGGDCLTGCGYWHAGVMLLGWCSCYFMLLGWCSCYFMLLGWCSCYCFMLLGWCSCYFMLLGWCSCYCFMLLGWCSCYFMLLGWCSCYCFMLLGWCSCYFMLLGWCSCYCFMLLGWCSCVNGWRVVAVVVVVVILVAYVCEWSTNLVNGSCYCNGLN